MLVHSEAKSSFEDTDKACVLVLSLASLCAAESEEGCPSDGGIIDLAFAECVSEEGVEMVAAASI